VARLALRNKRIVSTRQLRALGLDSAAVCRRVKDRRLTLLHKGVYLVGIGKPTREGRWLAAVVALLPGAYLGFRSCGVLHNLGVSEGKDTDVITTRRCKPRKGIAVHSARHLHPDDTTEIDGIPCTSIERTLVDLADVLTLKQLKRALTRAERERAVDYTKLAAAINRAHGRRGYGRLRQLIDYDPTPAAEAKEGLEEDLLDLVTAAGLPPYSRNVVVAGEEVDAYWPEANLVVELQSYTWHSDRDAFERDHAKIARLKLAGVSAVALTYRQVNREGDWVVDSLRKLLARGLGIG
jgi:hypothetical protein